jgi:hypothetical protein
VGKVSGTAVKYVRYLERGDCAETISHPAAIAKTRCFATVLLSKPLTIARRRTPAQQPLPSRLMNCRWPAKTSRVVGCGPAADINARDQANTSGARFKPVSVR